MTSITNSVISLGGKNISIYKEITVTTVTKGAVVVDFTGFFVVTVPIIHRYHTVTTVTIFKESLIFHLFVLCWPPLPPLPLRTKTFCLP